MVESSVRHAQTSAAPDRHRARLRTAVAGLVYLALALARSWPLRHVVWAEDGTVYVQDRLDRGSRAVLHAYGGYLQGIARLVVLAWPQSQFARWPMYFAVLSAVVWALVGTIVFGGIGQLLRHSRFSSRIRVTVATCAGAAVVLCPSAAVESIGNVANLQFPLLAGLGVVLAVQWPTRRVAAAGLIFTVAVTLSSPLVAFLVPPLLLRAVLDAWATPRVGSFSRRHLVVVLGVLGAGGAVQVVTYLVQPSVRQVPASGKGAAEALRYWASFWAPSQLPAGVAAALLVLLVALTVAALAPRLRRWTPGERAAVQLVGSAACLYLGSYVLAGATTPRYLIAPTGLLVAAGCVLAGERTPDRLATPWCVAAVAVALLFAASTITHFAPGDYRRSGANWRSAIAAARERCATGTVSATLGVGPTILADAQDWGVVTVSCDVLARIRP